MFSGRDIGKLGDEADKYVALIWVPPYAHVLVEKFGDLYSTDGTHNISSLGWRSIPLCVHNSLGNPHAIALAFATSENSDVMALMARGVNEVCVANGVPPPFATEHDRTFVDDRDRICDDDLDENCICSREWRPFIHSVLQKKTDVLAIPPPDHRPTFLSDEGSAFKVFAKVFNLRHVWCKMHLAANNHLGTSNRCVCGGGSVCVCVCTGVHHCRCALGVRQTTPFLLFACVRLCAFALGVHHMFPIPTKCVMRELSELGNKASELIWSDCISTAKATRLARELVLSVQSLPTSAKPTKDWASESFMDAALTRSAMAFHKCVVTLSLDANSGLENSFNILKKYQGAALKRSVLHDSVTIVLDVCERRFQTDALTIAGHEKWFVDMRDADGSQSTAELVHSHKKKLATGRLFKREQNKLQDAMICPWSTAIKIEHTDRDMWLLQEKTEEGSIAHLVEVTGFLWNDDPASLPPRCHTCPRSVNGRIPCIGILCLLSNLPPLVNHESTTAWMHGKGLMRPEIFHPRWRVDRDPTQHLVQYTAAPRSTPPPRHAQPCLPTEALATSEMMAKFKNQMERVDELEPLQKQAALVAIRSVLQKSEEVVCKYTLDSRIVRTNQVQTRSP